MRLLLPDGELAWVTPRCLADYIDQVRPCASADVAFKELQRLVNQHGTVSLERPAWMAPQNAGAPEWNGVPRWVLIGDVAVLVQYAASDPDALLAAAVVTRGSVSAQVRAIRAERGMARRARRKQASKKQNKSKQNARFRRERRDRLASEADSRRDGR